MNENISRYAVTIVCFLVLCSPCRQLESGSSADQEEVNPFVEAAKSFLNEALQNRNDGSAGLSLVGGMVQQFLQKDGSKHLGEIFSAVSGRSESSGGDDILAGIATMFADNKSGQEGGGGSGLDPNLLGQVANLLSNAISTEHPARSDSDDPKNNEIPSGGDQPANFDWGAAMQLVSNVMASSKGDKENSGSTAGFEGLLNLLPLLTGVGHPASHVHFADSELEDKDEHEMYGKGSLLPPFLSNLYEYWEHFKTSELGKTIWTKSGLESIFQLFIDEEGYFQMDRIFESMENISFRRKWIKSLSSFVGRWLKHLLDPATQARYLANAQFIGNGFLKAQGYSKAVQFDSSRPAESLSVLIDAVFKRQFGLKINSYTYIKPAIDYIKDVFKFGQSKGLSLRHLNKQEISSKMAEIINGDIIEPLLRVWRAYKYSIKNPTCDRHIMCTLNSNDNQSKNKIGLKPGVTKIFSLAAAWYLPNRTGTPFWKLYNAITNDQNCQVKYPADCKEFFDEDLRVTTEYAHSEL